MNDSPKPDRQQTQWFIDTLFPAASVGTFVLPRAFTENTRKAWRVDLWPTVIVEASGLNNIVEAVFTLVRRAANAAVPIAVALPICTFRDPSSAAEKNVADGLALAIECDRAPLRARERLTELLGPATLVVASGGLWTPPDGGNPETKLHCYWRLAHPARNFAEHVRLKEARRRAACLVDADLSGAPLAHPFRVPGSVHRKAEPVLTRLLQ